MQALAAVTDNVKNANEPKAALDASDKSHTFSVHRELSDSILTVHLIFSLISSAVMPHQILNRIVKV